MRRVTRGAGAASLLRRSGIDPVRYWLLLDLFQALTERREVLNALGRDGVSLRIITLIYAALMGLLSLGVALAKLPLATYSLVIHAMSGFVLLSILLPETSNSLLNPVEGAILSHQPVDGATFTAAKLSHLARIVFYLAPGLHLAAAFLPCYFSGAPWWFPAAHLAGAIAVGFVLALCCCALFGYLLRFIPTARLRAWGQAAEMLPWVAYTGAQLSLGSVKRLRPAIHLPPSTEARAAVIGLVVLAITGTVILGLRSLSMDYLNRVSNFGHSSGTPAAAARRSPLAELASRLFGGPEARAGFDFTGKMMLRDWQFRRQALPMIFVVVLQIGPIVKDFRGSPFSGSFSAAQFLPHSFGLMLFHFCSTLSFGGEYKGSWLFLLAPAGAMRRFAHGVWAALWLRIIVIPHLILAPALIWAWGPGHGLLFLLYSLTGASMYLGLEIRLIEGIPFCRQPEVRGPYLMPLLLLGALVMAIAVAVQHLFLFRYLPAAAAATVVLGLAGWLLTRRSLGAFEENIRFHLAEIANETQGIYHEVM